MVTGNYENIFEMSSDAIPYFPLGTTGFMVLSC
jgi:hypothetical protein